MTQPQWRQPPTSTPTGGRDPYAPQPAATWSANDPYGEYSHQDVLAYQPAPQLPYGYADPSMGRMDHPQTLTVFLLGLASVLALPVLGPVALFLGGRARREAREQPGRYAIPGLLTAGWIMGIVGTALMVLLGLSVVVMFLSFLAMS